jgi:hypothetical protein
MLQKHGGGVGTVFLKGFHISESGILIQSCVLIEFLPLGLSHQAGGRNEFHINLHPLSGV